MSALASSIPDTHRDCVLNAFLQGHTIPVLAEHYKLPVTAIVAFLNSPEIQSLRNDIAHLAASQAELATTHARTAAILTLNAVIDGHAIDPAQVRAASSLLRTTPKAPPRANHGAIGSPHVSKGSASQPHDAAHVRAHTEAGANNRPSVRADSHSTRHRHARDPDAHHEPIADPNPDPIAEPTAKHNPDPAHTDPNTPRHARAALESDEPHQQPARHEPPADAPAPDALHDRATPTANARDRPTAAAA